MTPPRIIDLFCGCGGFGLGAKLAGFDCRLAIDIDSTLQSAYRINFPQTRVVTADISTLDKQSWDALLGDFDTRPDGLIGGPPCQGFSRIGRRRQHDPRNSLIDHFFRQVDIVKPKFFLMENVEGLLDSGLVNTLMRALQRVAGKYTVLDPIIVRASDYGVATSRTRVMVIGYDAVEIDHLSVEDFAPPPCHKLVTVRDAISDLPSPYCASRKKGDYAWQKYPSMQGKKLSEFARWARTVPGGKIGWDLAIDKLKQKMVSGFDITRHNPTVEKRYGKLAHGKTDPISRSTKLDWTGLCPTLRAGTGPDKGSFQAVRPIHPDSPRVITVREAARLQGFPDWFVFHHTKWHSFRMIGNSVSPFASKGILSTILAKMNHNRQNIEKPYPEASNL